MTTILVVDDFEPVRYTIRQMLERGGYSVREAEDGRKGLNVIAQHAPDMVLTDISMPEMEGLQFLRLVTKNYPNLPVVVFTGSINPQYLEVALKLGAVHGLAKPFGQQELLDAVKKALRKSS